MIADRLNSNKMHKSVRNVPIEVYLKFEIFLKLNSANKFKIYPN